jgi:hypothetical protein
VSLYFIDSKVVSILAHFILFNKQDDHYCVTWQLTTVLKTTNSHKPIVRENRNLQTKYIFRNLYQLNLSPSQHSLGNTLLHHSSTFWESRRRAPCANSRSQRVCFTSHNLSLRWSTVRVYLAAYFKWVIRRTLALIAQNKFEHMTLFAPAKRKCRHSPIKLWVIERRKNFTISCCRVCLKINQTPDARCWGFSNLFPASPVGAGEQRVATARRARVDQPSLTSAHHANY